MTGAVIWRTKEMDQRGPLFLRHRRRHPCGVRQYIQTSYVSKPGDIHGELSGVDTKTGNVLWTEIDLHRRNEGIGCTTPIVKGNQVYITAGFGGGCHLFEIDAKQKATDLYSKPTCRRRSRTPTAASS